MNIYRIQNDRFRLQFCTYCLVLVDFSVSKVLLVYHLVITGYVQKAAYCQCFTIQLFSKELCQPNRVNIVLTCNSAVHKCRNVWPTQRIMLPDVTHKQSKVITSGLIGPYFDHLYRIVPNTMWAMEATMKPMKIFSCNAVNQKHFHQLNTFFISLSNCFTTF